MQDETCDLGHLCLKNSIFKSEIKHSPSLFFEQFEDIQNKPIIQISNKNYNQQSKTTSSKSSYLYQYHHIN